MSLKYFVNSEIVGLETIQIQNLTRINVTTTKMTH